MKAVRKTRIGLFGGSFDPPHKGHVACAEAALALGHLDALWVLPTDKHPYGKKSAFFSYRVSMCERAFETLERVSVLRFEANNLSGHTIEVVENLVAGCPNAEFVLIVGTDCIQDCQNWHRWSDLEKMVEVLEIPREGFSSSSTLPEVSSTQVRELVASGDETAWRKLVPHEVAEIILNRNLYGPPEKG